jgi:hypothetical protein
MDDFDRRFEETWNDIKGKQALATKWAWLIGLLWLIGILLFLAILGLVVYILARNAGLI